MIPEIDVTKDVCPMTFVKVKIAMTKIAPAGKLAVVLGEEALKNVITSVKTEGHRVTGVARRGPAYVIEVEKRGEAPG